MNMALWTGRSDRMAKAGGFIFGLRDRQGAVSSEVALG